MPTVALVPPAEFQPRPGPAVRTTRVLHVINGEHYAGAERVQDLLAEIFDALAPQLEAQGFVHETLELGQGAVQLRIRRSPASP